VCTPLTRTLTLTLTMAITLALTLTMTITLTRLDGTAMCARWWSRVSVARAARDARHGAAAKRLTRVTFASRRTPDREGHQSELARRLVANGFEPRLCDDVDVVAPAREGVAGGKHVRVHTYVRASGRGRG
jgi:hypothetical protein